ncbi:MAG: ABC transporter substrate-binding protein [Kangiellaceae bacterium]|nr:ABC transporter substrate-binding protein [Kangiellaceae bacterium]
MKTIFAGSLILLVFFTQHLFAGTPTESLTLAVDKILIVAANKEASDEEKKQLLSEIMSDEVDFEAVSKRVVSKKWKKATVEQKSQFKQQFLEIMVGTYSALLKNFSNEKVEYVKEQTKGKKYAIVDTKIHSDNKKIPVRYRMIKDGDNWKIYDFVPEGISLITTYKGNYSSILKKKGIAGLLIDMKKIEAEKAAKAAEAANE